VRRGLVRLSAAAAAAAAVLGLWTTWPLLGDERSDLTRAEAAGAAAVNERLPLDEFEAMRARVGRGDTWWIEVPEGDVQGLTTRGAVYRTFALYWLLPALPAGSREEADAVFRIPRAS
jgi:hypothetical protein